MNFVCQAHALRTHILCMFIVHAQALFRGRRLCFVDAERQCISLNESLPLVDNRSRQRNENNPRLDLCVITMNAYSHV